MADLDDARRRAKAISQSHPDATMRAATDAAEQALEKIATEISLDAGIYDKLQGIDVSGSDDATRHWMFKVLRDFRRAGVDRDDATRSQASGDPRGAGPGGPGVPAEHQRRHQGRGAATRPPWTGLPEDYVRAHPAGDDGKVRDHHRLLRLHARS